MRTLRVTSWIVLLLLSVAAPAYAAEPPGLINYQGVLRDAAGAPIDGSFPMAFHFYDAEVGGNQLLTNTPDPVTASGGLFNVALGSGLVADGTGPGAYASLADVFGEFDTVYMEIFVGGEMLTPRVRVVASAYALNADRLDGKHAAEFLDTSVATQVKAGDLGVDDLSVGGQISIAGGSPGAGKVLTSDATGQADWMDPPFDMQQALLRGLADRLQTTDPQGLPFAELGSFDCAGASTATLGFTIDGLATGTVTGFVGRDAISSTFEYLVALESGSPIVESAQIGKLGRLTITHASGGTTYSGRITEFGLAAFDTGVRTYVARLEPRVVDLARSSGYDILQAINVPDRISGVFVDAGIANYQISVAGSYPPADMILQYNETSFDFVSRLAENAGLHYHFEEQPSEEVVVWSDTNAQFPTIAGTFPYDGDMAGPGASDEFVSTFHARDRRYTGNATIRGYDFTNPAATIQGTAAIAGGVGEVYEFYASGVDNTDATTQAQIAIDRDQVRATQHSGTSNITGLKAGHKFTIVDNTAAGFGGLYVVSKIDHFALAGDPACIQYGNVFQAVPDTTTYRPPRVTPKPVVKGPMTALVTGPGGEVIWTDSYGRVKVKFHWDRVNPSDENSSGWIRVAVPSGRTDDFRWVPRVGTEVVVDFLQGDPDRPIIVGSVYNNTDLPPATDALVLGDDLTVTGNDIFFGSGARLLSSTNTTLQTLGDANSDDLLLYAGNSLDDGSLRIFGDSTFESRSGSGLFTFVNGATGIETGRLDSTGSLQIDSDLTVSGGDATLGTSKLVDSGTALTISAGNADTDSLLLRAGNSADDGQITINGNAGMTLSSGNGTFTMAKASTSFLMTVNQTSATLNEWKLGGANLDLFLGDSGADDVFVPGNFSVTGTKNFVQNHPHRRDLSVVYTALEGDEAGTYTRGSARLSGGEARVPLGGTFSWVTNPDIGLTAHVTSRSEWADLYVASVSTTELVVRGRNGSDPEAAFDYIVHGLRVGYEEYSVLQPRRMDGSVPSPESVERYYEQHEGLRSFNSLQRFSRMDAGDRAQQPLQSRAASLRAAIGERDRFTEAAIDGRDPVVPSVAIARPSTPENAEPDAAPTTGRQAERDAGAPALVGTVPLDDHGHAYARSFRTVDSELAALIPVSEDAELGDLVVVDANDPTRMRPASRAADPAVVGVISGRPGVLLGGERDPETAPVEKPQAPVAFSGITTVKVDAGYGAIRVGDLLTSSPTVGHAMRVDEPLMGTIVGKALEPLESGTGRIRVLVMLR